MAANGVVTLDHPTYSPDLAPVDLSPDLAPVDVFLFPRFRSALNEKRFTDIIDIQSNVTAELEAIPKELFYWSFQDVCSFLTVHYHPWRLF
ncbi:hypothetical protein TNCV_4371731 [Trichonephila clavipes]|nr:hypothetical protein TNCV_4371731 [Trichonephila clavipes]